MTQYKALPLQPMSHEAKINRRMMERPGNVSMENPAVWVMTDLSRVIPFSIEPTASIEQANNRMIACGVRSLFVTDLDGNLIGLISASDILGEKPVQYMKEHGGRREDILAQDIMLHKNQLNVLRKDDVERATVGDIIETMKPLGRQHALVVEQDEQGTEIVCGIFSTTQIERQTDVQMDTVVRANTFADVGLAVLSK